MLLQMYRPVIKISVGDKHYWYSRTNRTLYYDHCLTQYCPLSNFDEAELESIKLQIKPSSKPKRGLLSMFAGGV
jgi:hypothetical protein